MKEGEQPIGLYTYLFELFGGVYGLLPFGNNSDLDSDTSNSNSDNSNNFVV